MGRYTYTTDLRYEALHQNGTNQWTLRIRSAQPRDQGTYECQVSTKPVKTFTTYLRVLGESRGEGEAGREENGRERKAKMRM